MKIQKVLSLIIVVTSFIIYGCGDTVTSTSTVTGKVLGYDNFSVAGIKVSISGRDTYSANDGSFSFENVDYPYDIVLLDANYEKTAKVYKNISTDNLNLYFETSGSIQYYSTVYVNLPSNINFEKLKGKLFFTDGNYVNEITNLSSNTSGITIKLHENKPVRGKIIILTYLTNDDYEIISYENYGESEMLNLTNGNIINYTFDSTSLSLNPGEQNVLVEMKMEIETSLYSAFYLTFGKSYSLYGENYLNSFQERQFNFLIPSGIPMEFKTFVTNEAYNSSGQSVEDFQVYPNITNTLVVKNPCELIRPEDNSKNLSNQTEFSFQDGDGKGIYTIYLEDVSRNIHFRIYTKENNFNLENLDQLGLGRINNNNFYWLVQKEGHTESMNDYVTNYKNIQGKFKTTSQIRFFSTMP